jgi:hypothetical protein
MFNLRLQEMAGFSTTENVQFSLRDVALHTYPLGYMKENMFTWNGALYVINC